MLYFKRTAKSAIAISLIFGVSAVGAKGPEKLIRQIDNSQAVRVNCNADKSYCCIQLPNGLWSCGYTTST